MRILIATTIVFTALLTTACEEVQTRHITWVQSPACSAPGMGDTGCVDLGAAQDMGDQFDMGCEDMAPSAILAPRSAAVSSPARSRISL